MQEFRLIHPEPRYDLTFAIELKEKIFFPIQDCRGNICALQKDGTSLAEWYRYSAFGEKIVSGDLQGLFNPWRFANKREVEELSLFPHRFYNPRLMRWQTTDPLGFEDSLNLYAYVHNNPFRYKDPDGRIAIFIEVVVVTFDLVVTWLTVETVAATAATIGLSVAVYQANKHLNEENTVNQIEVDGEDGLEVVGDKKGRRKGKDNEIRGGPPREQSTGNYLPDPAAEGTPHTTFGIRKGGKGPYNQGATFDEKGKFSKRIDATNHGRGDHPNPHSHRATGPNSANSPAEPIQDFFW